MSVQRYRSGIAHERMEQGLCPECGKPAAEHSSRVEFWLRPGAFTSCDLLPHGVEERIAQYVEDRDAAASLESTT